MKCNSQADLHLEMARIYLMCTGTVFEMREYLCVKLDQIPYCIEHPRFEKYSPCRFEFALEIVEDKPVWEGSILYSSGCTKPSEMIIEKTDGRNLYGSGCCIALEYMSWNPPAPPKPKTETKEWPEMGYGKVAVGTKQVELDAANAVIEQTRTALQAMVDEARARNCGLKIADDTLALAPDLSALKEHDARVIEEVANKFTSVWQFSQGYGTTIAASISMDIRRFADERRKS